MRCKISEGSHAFSLNELARSLEIRPPSLYNHIRNMEELINEVGIRVTGMLREAEMDAIDGKHGDEALAALCDAYRTFAEEHAELYRINMGRQLYKGSLLSESQQEIVDPIFLVLSEYQLKKDVKMHWHRIIRAMMHGFIMQEYGGRFHGFPVDHEESYHMAVKAVIRIALFSVPFL